MNLPLILELFAVHLSSNMCMYVYEINSSNQAPKRFCEKLILIFGYFWKLFNQFSFKFYANTDVFVCTNVCSLCDYTIMRDRYVQVCVCGKCFGLNFMHI